MKTESIKNDLSKSLGKKKWYNPNTFNLLDAAICFAIVLLVFLFIREFIGYPLSYIYKNVVQDYFFIQILASIVTQGSLFLIGFIYFKIRKVGIFSGEGYHFKINARDLLMSLILIFGVYLTMSPLHMEFFDYMTDIFGDLGLTVPQEAIDNSSTISILFYAYVVVPVFPAICEELIFRGILMRGMKERGCVFAALFSSLLFALTHGSVGMILLQFVVGLVISSIVMITKNHIYGCILHCAYNLGTSLIAIAPAVCGELFVGLDSLVNAMQMVVGVVLLIVGLYYFIKKCMGIYKNKVLGVNKSIYKAGDKEICYTNSFEADTFYTFVPFDYDDSKVKQDDVTMFLYNDKFIHYNKKTRKIWLAILFFAIGTLLALYQIFF